MAGKIEAINQNFHVRINHRYPWTIRYHYQAGGALQRGQISTLSRPGLRYQLGAPIPVLYDAQNPAASTLYSNALGYFE